MSGELDHALTAIQRLLALVDELAGLGCDVAVTVEVNGHTVGIEAPRRASELRYVSIPDEVNEAQQ